MGGPGSRYYRDFGSWAYWAVGASRTDSSRSGDDPRHFGPYVFDVVKKKVAASASGIAHEAVGGERVAVPEVDLVAARLPVHLGGLPCVRRGHHVGGMKAVGRLVDS